MSKTANGEVNNIIVAAANNAFSEEFFRCIILAVTRKPIIMVALMTDTESPLIKA